MGFLKEISHNLTAAMLLLRLRGRVNFVTNFLKIHVITKAYLREGYGTTVLLNGKGKTFPKFLTLHCRKSLKVVSLSL
jgi:hypothetical protein